MTIGGVARPYPSIRSESGGGELRLQQIPRTWPAIDQGQGPPVRTLSLSASDLKRKMKDEASKKGRRGSLLTGEKDCGSIPQRAYPINQRISNNVLLDKFSSSSFLQKGFQLRMTIQIN
ncbi:hypothetical protein GQ457_18G013450 [Hibiscus cannabinus]